MCMHTIYISVFTRVLRREPSNGCVPHRLYMSVRISSAGIGRYGVLQVGKENVIHDLVLFIYFSTASQTGTGFGDVTPIHFVPVPTCLAHNTVTHIGHRL